MFEDFPVPPNKSGGELKSDFMGLIVGDSKVGVLAAGGRVVYKHFKGEYPNSTFAGVCTGSDCKLCLEEIPKKYELWQNFLTLDDSGAPVMMILTGPGSLATSLRDVEVLTENNDFFTGRVVNIERSSNTKYAIKPVKPEEVPVGLKNTKKILAEIPTHDLEKIFKAMADKVTGTTKTTAPF